MARCDYERAEVEYLIEDFHLPRKPRQGVEVALQLISFEVFSDHRYVDPTTFTDHELVNN